MTASPIDQAYLQYQKTGNPDFLAEVFDATARRLLRVANHLAPDPHEAEDLVQATFLVAIQGRADFEHKASVVSWLVAILQRTALHRYRQSGRKLDAERLAKGNAPDASAELEAKDLSDAVAEAIARMPDPYKPVLNLHLRHGLSTSEIALNLDRQSGTVRSQLSRGLAMLRKALPASLVAGSVALTTPAYGLAAMREVVLSKATVSLAAQSAASSSALVLGKVGLWVAAGTLSAAAMTLALNISTAGGGELSLDELSLPASAQAAVVEEDSVGTPVIATAELRADPFPQPSQGVAAFPASNSIRKATPMTNIKIPYSPPSTLEVLGVPSLLLGAMTLLPALGQAQSVVYYHNGDNAGDNLARYVSGVGDVNQDGYDDYAVTSHRYDLDPDGTPASGDELSNAGRIYVYSGKNGTTIYTFDGERASDGLARAVSGGGDINFDGFPDIAAATHFYDPDPDGTPATGDEVSNGGRAYAFSGKDGSTLYTFDGLNASDNMGRSVAIAGDMNLDGYADIAACAYGFDLDPDGTPSSGDELSGAGRTYVFSGINGSTLYTFDGERANDHLGEVLAAGRDMDGDGFDELLAAADGYDLDPDGTPSTGDEFSNAGRIYVFSGQTGSTLYTFDGENASDSLGRSASGAGDVNGDGTPDIIVGSDAYKVDPDGTPATGDEMSAAGRAYVFSGFDGSTLYTFDGGAEFDSMGMTVAEAGDVNGDGYGDVVACATGFDVDPLGPDGLDGQQPGPDGTMWTADDTNDDIDANGRAYVFSGKDGSTLYTVTGEVAADALGQAASFAGDVNADGAPDILLGAWLWDDPADAPGTSHGRAYLVSGAPLSLTADTHALSLSVANSQTMIIDAGISNALKNYWLFTGFAASGDTPGVTMTPGVVIPLNQPDPLTSFVIGLTQLGGGAPTFMGWKSTLDVAGMASPSLNTFGPTPAPLGVTLHHAALVYTSNGCGAGCDTFQLATNWVPMTTTP